MFSKIDLTLSNEQITVWKVFYSILSFICRMWYHANLDRVVRKLEGSVRGDLYFLAEASSSIYGFVCVFVCVCVHVCL